MSPADAAAKVEYDRKLLRVALDAVKSTAQTVRHIYYLITGQGLLPKGDKAERSVKGIVGVARWDGDLPWDDIVDGGRELIDWEDWESAEDFLNEMKSRFVMDEWKGQPARVIVVFEKDTLAGMLEPICREWHVPFISFHGQASDTIIYRLAKWCVAQDAEKIVCLYLGDWDPAGFVIDGCVFGQSTVEATDISVDLSVKIAQLEESPVWNSLGKLRVMLARFFPEMDYRKIEYRRIGINAEDIKNRKFNKFKLKAKERNDNGSKNKFYPGFMGQTGGDPRTLGIDALTHEQLTTRTEDAIKQHIDWGIWAEQQERYETELEKIQ